MEFGSIDPLVARVPNRTRPAQPRDQLVSSISIDVEPLHALGACGPTSPTSSPPSSARSRTQPSSSMNSTEVPPSVAPRLNNGGWAGFTTTSVVARAEPLRLSNSTCPLSRPNVDVVSGTKPKMSDVTHWRLDVNACIWSVCPSRRSLTLLPVVLNESRSVRRGQVSMLAIAIVIHHRPGRPKPAEGANGNPFTSLPLTSSMCNPEGTPNIAWNLPLAYTSTSAAPPASGASAMGKDQTTVPSG